MFEIFNSNQIKQNMERGVFWGKGRTEQFPRRCMRNGSKTTQAKTEMVDLVGSVFFCCVVFFSYLHVFSHASNTHYSNTLFTSLIIIIFIVSNTNATWSKCEFRTHLSNLFHKTNVVGRETWAGSRWDLVHVWGSTSSEKPLAREALRRSSSQRTLRMETM